MLFHTLSHLLKIKRSRSIKSRKSKKKGEGDSKEEEKGERRATHVICLFVCLFVCLRGGDKRGKEREEIETRTFAWFFFVGLAQKRAGGFFEEFSFIFQCMKKKKMVFLLLFLPSVVIYF